VNITEFQGQVRRWVVQCFGSAAVERLIDLVRYAKTLGGDPSK